MRRVEVTAYDPNWPLLYATEAEILSAILGAGLIRLHHIGSTSVPRLAAKPIIDILAEVREIEKLDSLNQKMTAAGYTPMGEYGISGRRYFFKGSSEVHTHHVHAFAVGHPEIGRHLRFRDYLRCHPEAVWAYAALKKSLARKFPLDVEAYANAKDDFIHDIDRQALDWAKLQPNRTDGRERN